ncbi:peptidase inhibitor family I36 protein [Nocardia cyriacigeorgica]|uniref:Peptidase inhibitor family I36 n=1 Tax=Nocardia cyriacigeorgica TaxID=135487 RepID=A0A5R8NU37_9NOCA|nr:peptidase inhibitor family I36 protein [Nocardia cyriacigeorgica]TLF79089.1 hypothetical protein FEK34_06620 [Nocardia cyriacigeorgica]
MHLRRTISSLSVMALGVSGALFTATPARAEEGYDRCPAGYYCMFSGLDGTGDMIKLTRSTPDLAVFGMNDLAKSDWNRTSSKIHLWSDARYTGCTAVTDSGPTGKGNFFPAYRDFFSSVGFGGPAGPPCGGPVDSSE